MPFISPKSNAQPKTTPLSRVGDKQAQVDWLARNSDEAAVLDINVIRKQGTLLNAMLLCLAASGKEPKQIYMDLGLDPATWSRIQSGQTNFPVNRIPQMMELCGNEAPLIWLLERMGYDWKSVRKHQSDSDRVMAEQRQEIADLKRLLKLKTEANL